MLTSFIIVIAAVAIAGVVAWWVLSLPMPPIFSRTIVAIICIALILFMLSYFGISDLGLHHR